MTVSFAARRTALVFFIAAVSIRLPVLALTYEMPGDGPTRAMLAFEWARAPSFPLWGGWPPGFLFLSGPVEALIRDPRISVRVLNLVLGSLTVVALYALARRLYGEIVAVASACVLCLLPLHVGLSASSMTEPAFVLELVLALLLVTESQSGVRSVRLRASLVVAGILCLILASMTRYEAWPLLPLFIVHHAVRTRSLRATGLVTISLLAFPLVWTLSNYIHTGDALVGFTAATAYIGIPPTPATAAHALELMASWGDWQLGWLLPWAILLGVGLELFALLRGESVPSRILYLSVVLMQCLVMLRFTMVRGEFVWTRYLLGSVVLALPFAFVPFSSKQVDPASRDAAQRLSFRGYALAALAVATLFLPWLDEPARAGGHWVTTRRPVAVAEVAAWLRESGRDDQSILLTPMNWEATYLALGAPQTFSRSLIVSEWIDDTFLRRWIWDYRPALLVTRTSDEAFANRIETALEFPLAKAVVLYRSDDCRVLDISGATTPEHIRWPRPPD
jgi:hypothetical protein